MPKVITIKEEAYEKLLKIKRMVKGSFSDAIIYLYQIHENVSGKRELLDLAGTLKPSMVDRRRLRKVFKLE